MITTRNLTLADKEQARELQHQTFKDPIGFENWYFDNRFTPNDSFGAFENGKLISMSHGYRMKIHTLMGNVTAMMISCVATLPKYQRQGLMHAVITAQLDHCKRQEIPIAFNKPVVLNTYRRLGFEPCTWAKLYKCDSPSGEALKLIQVDFAHMHQIYNTVMQRYCGYVIRDGAGFELKMNDYLSAGMKLLAFEDGYCAYALNEGVCHIDEIVSSGDYMGIICAVHQKEGLPISAKLPPDCSFMGKVVPMNVYALTDREAGESILNYFDKDLAFCIDEY